MVTPIYDSVIRDTGIRPHTCPSEWCPIHGLELLAPPGGDPIKRHIEFCDILDESKQPTEEGHS